MRKSNKRRHIRNHGIEGFVQRVVGVLIENPVHQLKTRRLMGDIVRGA
jgi:hypothetical protein